MGPAPRRRTLPPRGTPPRLPRGPRRQRAPRGPRQLQETGVTHSNEELRWHAFLFEGTVQRLDVCPSNIVFVGAIYLAKRMPRAPHITYQKTPLNMLLSYHRFLSI